MPSGHRSALDRAGRREGAEPYGLALDLSGRQPEKKLGKQRSVFPGRRSAEKVASRSPLRHAKGMTLSPAGSGDAAQWAASITDRGGSRDAGTAAAVTERATYQRYHTAHVQGPRSPQKTKDTPFLWRCPFLLGGTAARPPKIKFGGALTTAAEGRMLYT